MNRITLARWNVLMLFAGLLLGQGAMAQVGTDPRVDTQIVIRLQATATVAQFTSAFQANNPAVSATEIDDIVSRRIHLLELTLPPGYDEAFLVALEDDLLTNYLNVLMWGEFVYENQAPEGKTGSTWVDGVATEVSFDSQYAGNVLGLDTAHQTATGQGTVVAVLDTGIDPTHPRLTEHVRNDGYNFVLDSTSTPDVGDGLDNDGDGDTDEMTGHGTYVAGLITLAAPDAGILPVTVLDSDGVGTGWLLAKGVFFAIDRGVEVINLSLSSTYRTQAVEDAIEEAKGLGIVVVAAAGNFDRSDPREFPAMASNTLGVAATDVGDLKAPFSNFSDRLFISAPGATDSPLGPAIVSTLPGGTYGVWEGTSFATPFVSAAAAIIRSQHPDWGATEVTQGLIADTLAISAVDISAQNPTYIGMLGAGRLNVAMAIQQGPVSPTAGDLDGNGVVDADDFLDLLADWGKIHSAADLDGSGNVGVDDFLILLMNWG